MADNSNINSNMYLVVNADPFTFVPVSLKQQFYLPPSGGSLGAVKQGAGIMIATDGTISATGAFVGVNSLAVNPTGLPRTGALSFLAGSNITLVDNNDNTFTISASGGGGGGLITTAGLWASGATSKNQYTSPGVINAQGINLTLTASSGMTLLATQVTCGGTMLTGPFTVAGTFPNYTITIAAANVPDSVQLAGGQVTVTGTLDGNNFFSTGNTLTTVAPIAYSATSTARFQNNSYPFYTSSAVITISGADVGTNTAIALTLTNMTTTETVTDFRNYTSTTLFPFMNTTYAGTITGTGTNGAGSTAVPISQTLTTPTIYTPAYYIQTADATVPTITAATSTQTASDAQGSTITMPIATAMTQYNWIITTRPLTSVRLQTPFGTTPLTPDVNQTGTITGGGTTVFNFFGWTGLVPGQASVVVIS